MNYTKISIGLPVYNGERFIKEAIDSILCQTYTNFELIISDNASTDMTEEICRTYLKNDSRICYYRAPENRGASWNFNQVFQLSTGKYFKWAAHDDLLHPDFLAKCITVLEENPSVVLCFTKTDFIDEKNNNMGEYEFPIDISKAKQSQIFCLYSGGGHIVHEIFGVIRTEVLRKTPLIGSYAGSDLVLLGRLALKGYFHQIPERLFLHREHWQRSTEIIKAKGIWGYTQWYDSSKSGRFSMPYWRRLFENTKSIAHSNITLQEKFGCFWDMCRCANWNRSVLWNELLHFIGDFKKHG